VNSVLISALAFIVAIGILVAVHEYGHYIVARLLGVKVLRYSIGFGRPLWLRRSGPDQTEYCISAIPLGGYVKLLDEREGNVPESELPRSFTRQPILSRIAILVAGPAMNFLFAIAAYWLMFVIGVPGAQPIVGKVEPQSIAATAGIESGDRILQVGDSPVSTWEGAILFLLDEVLDNEVISIEVENEAGLARVVQLDITGQLTELTKPGQLFPVLGLAPWRPIVPAIVAEVTPDSPAAAAGVLAGDRVVEAGGEPLEGWTDWVYWVRERPGEPVSFVVERNGSRVQLSATIGEAEIDGETVGQIGMAVQQPDKSLADKYRADQRYAVIPSLREALYRTWSMSELTVRMLGRMVIGDVSVKNISGPINIAEYAGYSARIGFAPFLSFLAIVSVSLGVLNLLPIPVLDGGQVIYQLAEAVKGAPLSEKAQLIGQQIGIAFLVLVMSFAFYNDLSRFF